MGNITKLIANDYTHGIIRFNCDSLDDIRKIGAIIDSIAFKMRFENIDEIKGKKMNEILKDMSYSLFLLEHSALRMASSYDGKEMPNYVEFLVTHIKDNIAPGLRGFISQVQIMDMLVKSEQIESCAHKNISVTSFELTCKDCNEKLG